MPQKKSPTAQAAALACASDEIAGVAPDADRRPASASRGSPSLAMGDVVGLALLVTRGAVLPTVARHAVNMVH